MSRLRAPGLAPILAVVALACGHPDTSRVAVSHDGTALVGRTHKVHGVTTVEFPADAFDRAAQYVLDTVPIAILGRVGDRQKRVWFSKVEFLASGGYASMSFTGAESHLLFFDSTGLLLHTVGAGSVSSLLALGDTLLVAGSGGLTYLTSGGDTLETVSSSPQPTNPEFLGQGWPVGRLDAGHLVWQVPMPSAPDTTRSVRTPVGVVISGMMHDSARLVDSIPGLEKRPIVVHYEDHDRTRVVDVWFSYYPRIVVWDNRIAVATGANGYAIDLLDTDGHLVRRVHVAVPRRPVTQEMRDSLRIQMTRVQWPFDHVEGTPIGAEARAYRLALQPFADSLPAYGSIYATRRGVLWVLDDTSLGDTAWNATAFRSDGAILGRLHGSGMTPTAFDDDRLVVRTPDGGRGVSFKVFRFRLPK